MASPNTIAMRRKFASMFKMPVGYGRRVQGQEHHLPAGTRRASRVLWLVRKQENPSLTWGEYRVAVAKNWAGRR